MKRILLILSFFSLVINMQAQRYLTSIFDEVDVQSDVVYGSNATLLYIQQTMEAIPEALKMDIYSPKGDLITDRPLVIMLHTGNFLPPQVNGGCQGTKSDADNVMIATRLAKMGYVVANIDYRLGWNPLADMQVTRVFTLINAVYRGLQDTKTCARFFRRATAENANPYGIDPSKIVSWGLGTGGYVSLANATLDSSSQTHVPKFLIPIGGGRFIPMVSDGVNGNVEATSVGIVPRGFPGLTEGDTLCYINHAGYSSEFSMAVNMGGSLGDTVWLDPTDIPIMSFQVPTDPFAPCGKGIVIVPPPINQPVVEVFGACASQPIYNRMGLNDCMKSVNQDDDISKRAKSLNGGLEGFYPFVSSDLTEGSPWQFSNTSEPYGIANSDCDTDVATASLYIDTVLMFFAPRAFECLDLHGVAVKDVLSANTVGLTATPNPARDQMLIETDEDYKIQDAFLYSMTGELVKAVYGINNNSWDLERGALNSGMFLLQLRFENGIATQKVIFE